MNDFINLTKKYFSERFDAKIESEYGERDMEIDLRRFSLMNKYCSLDGNVLECNKAAELTHIKVCASFHAARH